MSIQISSNQGRCFVASFAAVANTPADSSKSIVEEMIIDAAKQMLVCHRATDFTREPQTDQEQTS